MIDDEKPLYNKRVWLNKKRGHAHIIASIHGRLERKKRKYSKKDKEYWDEPYINGYFEIGDCTNIVSLEFDIHDFKDKRQVKKIKDKLALFRKSFEDFEQSMLTAIEGAENEY